MSDVLRLSTIVYRMRSFFRVNSNNDLVGFRVSKSDIDATVAPDNYIVGSGVKKIVVSSTAPSSPQVGDIWIDIGSPAPLT